VPLLSVDQFAARMSEAIPVIMKEFARRHLVDICHEKITLPQMLILNALHTRGEVKMKDLAICLRVSMPAMTGIISRLVRDKYCQRVYQEQDRRIIKVRLTAKGEAFLEKVNAGRKQMILKVFSKISDKDRQDYLRIITQIKDILIKGQDEQ
jgi:DNA-binding MarR family transcriptional regulator